MRRLILLAAVLALSVTAHAQQSSQLQAIGWEVITVAASSVGFTAATLNPDGAGPATRCYGRLETGEIRFRIDGGAPTSSVGLLLEIGEQITIDGPANLSRFRAIRTGGTSGSLSFVCSR